MDEQLKKYLEEKYANQLSDINAGQAFANLGDVIAGKQVGSTNPFFSEQRKLAEHNTLGMYEREQDRLAKQEQAKEALQLRLMGLAQQKQMGEAGLELKKSLAEQGAEIKKQKADELSAVQAKQLGLAEIGQLANKQYEEAVKEGFKPTEYSSKIDFMTMMPQFLKSDAGKKAVAAQSNWVEAYLRDASGAAIPPSERGAYADDFFPRPGDTDAIVANKAEMRKQKEQNALIGAGKGQSKFKPSTEKVSSYPKKLMKGSQSATVSNEQEEKEARAEGWQ